MYVHVVAAPDVLTRYACLLFLVPVSAGYPSPADDNLDGSLDLNQHLIKHPLNEMYSNLFRSGSWRVHA
jgi:DNA polymerase V